MTASHLLESIAHRIADYRMGEITPISPAHVDRWVRQFDPAAHDVILGEMDHLLSQCYVPREQMRRFLEVVLASKQIFGADVMAGLRNTRFLCIQRKGNSQRDLLGIVDEILKERYGFHTSDCGLVPARYVYLDDALFSGNTVLYDVLDWLPSTTDNTRLHLVFYAVHTSGVAYLWNRLAGKAREYGVQLSLWKGVGYANNIHPRDGQHDCFWPRLLGGDPNVDSYIADVNERCRDRGMTPRLFRAEGFEPANAPFSSPAGRALIEREFLRAGAYIRTLPREPKHEMRPMGYEKLESLGFGAVFISYRNIANNCPLALWWGDPAMPNSHPLSKWYPLFPRRANESRWYGGGDD